MHQSKKPYDLLRSQRGYALTQWLVFILIIVTLYFAYILIPVFFTDYKLGRLLPHTAVEFSSVPDLEEVKIRTGQRIYRKVNLLLDEKDLNVSRIDGKLSISINYTKTVYFLFYGDYKFKFSHKASGVTVDNPKLQD